MSQVSELSIVSRVSKIVFSPPNFSYLPRHNLAEELSLPFQTLVFFFKFVLLLVLNWKMSDRIPFLPVFFLELFTKYVTVSRKLL